MQRPLANGPGDPAQAGGLIFPFGDAADEAAIIAETRRWLERAVIGLNLCPFAKAVYAKGQIRFAVTGASEPRELLSELRHELALLVGTDPQAVDTTLLIHPRVLADFTDAVPVYDEAHRLLRKAGLEGTLQIASFHPDYLFGDAPPDDPANASNRSPRPMLHLLREASLDRALAAFPDPADIYQRNLETLRRLGHEGWRRLMAAPPQG